MRRGALRSQVMKVRIVIVSPCRDEEATLERTIACMRVQTYPPERWVIVDDGSSDRTPQILDRAALDIPWLRVVRRQNRGFRKFGGDVIDAFYDGLRLSTIKPMLLMAKHDMGCLEGREDLGMLA